MRPIDFFDRGAGLHPGRRCLVDQDGARTYAEVRARSVRIANALIAAGITPGAAAAVYSPNAAAAFECVLGVLRADLAWTPVNARAATDEIALSLDRADVSALFYHSVFDAEVARLRSRCPKIRLFVCIDGPAEALAAFIEDAPGDHAPDRSLGPDAVTTISQTGGTTGLPKGVMWSSRTWSAMIANFHVAFPCAKAPTHLVVAPMTHAAGAIAMMLMPFGATHVIHARFDPEAVLHAIETEGVTHLFLPPTALYALLAHPGVADRDYSSLEYFLVSAAPTSIEKLRDAVKVFGPVMASAFGQVEAPAMCTALPPAELVEGGRIREDRLGSCGRRTLLTAVEIMDDAGNLLPPGAVGEIVVRGDLVMLGYHRDQAATDSVSGFGWHHTGDVGYRSDDGYFFIVDRKKDMIITGGFNVFSAEVEQVLGCHPAVLDCAVIGVPDDKWGEAVKAVVQLKPGAAPDAATLLDFAKERLGGVKAPKTVEFWDELPRSAAGKVLKRRIRDVYWTGLDRSI